MLTNQRHIVRATSSSRPTCMSLTPVLAQMGEGGDLTIVVFKPYRRDARVKLPSSFCASVGASVVRLRTTYQTWKSEVGLHLICSNNVKKRGTCFD